MKPTEVCHQDICAQMSQLVSFQMQISQKLSIGKKCVPVALALNIADIYPRHQTLKTLHPCEGVSLGP